MQAEQPEVPAPLSSPRGLKARFDNWRHHNPKTEAVTFFFGGFCFDLLMLHRIDSAPMLIHQGTYLSLLAVLLVADHAEERECRSPSGGWGRSSRSATDSSTSSSARC
jgi:hypothetical protein